MKWFAAFALVGFLYAILLGGGESSASLFVLVWLMFSLVGAYAESVAGES